MSTKNGSAQLVEMLSVGPFGGIDPTTPPYYVSPNNVVDGQNFVPNSAYGGFVTVQGRNTTGITGLPSVPTGIHCFHRQGLPDIYIFACDVIANYGTGPQEIGVLYFAPLGGVAEQLFIPQGHLTPGQQTFFADCQQWVFLTNGVDTPLKIDINLNVTYWGIKAPTVAPTFDSAGPGALLGTYYYCFTYGNTIQESSQGTISQPFAATQATAQSNAFIVAGEPIENEVITFYAGAVGSSHFSVSYTVQTAQSVNDVALALITAINIDPYVSQYVVAGVPTVFGAAPGQISLSAPQPGIVGNQSYFWADVAQATFGETGTTVTPNTLTLLEGGTSGNTIELTGLLGSLIPSGDPQVTQLNIYRIGGSLGTWNLITTLDFPLTQNSYYDDLADDLVTGQQLTVFRDPPPAFAYIAAHMERVFGFGVNPCANTNGTITADPSLMGWSNLNEPWGFNFDVNTFTCGDNHFSDVAMGLAEMGGVLMALKTRRCYWIYGSTDSDFQPIFAWYVGNAAPRSVAVGYGFGFWLSHQGVHYTDGYNKYQISDGAFQQSNIKNILSRLSSDDLAAAVGFIYDRQYYLSFPTQNFTLLYDMRLQQWYKLSFATSCASFDLDSSVPVVGANIQTAGQIDQWFDGPCDLGGTVSAWMLSRTTDAGVATATKELYGAMLLAPAQPGACAKVIVTADPDTDQQASFPVTIDDLGPGTGRHEWTTDRMNCFRFNVWVGVDGPAFIDKVSVYGRIKRDHEPDLLSALSETIYTGAQT